MNSRHARNAARAWFAGLTFCSWIIGALIMARGNSLGARDYNYNVVPWGLWAAFFFALPFITLALQGVMTLLSLAATEHQRYVAWKGTLPPHQRAMVEASELAALAAAAYGLHEHHKRADARLTDSVMGRGPGDHARTGPSDCEPEGPQARSFGRDGASVRVLPGVAPHRDN